MSLFENDAYRWRDTYFVLFHEEDRPSCEAMVEALQTLGPRYCLQDVRRDEQGRLESLTLLSPDDFSAMDISYVSGEEVTEQVESLTSELRSGKLTREESDSLRRVQGCDARFDIYHFEQVVLPDDDDDEGFLDPGALLIVLQYLAKLCKGVSIDPQSGTVV
jgi:hypothetical protein